MTTNRSESSYMAPWPLIWADSRQSTRCTDENAVLRSVHQLRVACSGRKVALESQMRRRCAGKAKVSMLIRFLGWWGLHDTLAFAFPACRPQCNSSNPRRLCFAIAVAHSPNHLGKASRLAGSLGRAFQVASPHFRLSCTSSLFSLFL